MPSRLEGFRIEPGGEPQRLDGLPRLLFLQRSCSEGRKWAGKQDAGGGMATLHPLVGGRVSSKKLSSISICQGEQPAPGNSEPHEALCPFYSSTQADRRLWGHHPSHDQLVTEAGAERAEPLGRGHLPKHRAREADAGSGQEWCPHPHPQTGTYSAEVRGVRAGGAHGHRVSCSRRHVQDGAWLGGAGHS